MNSGSQRRLKTPPLKIAILICNHGEKVSFAVFATISLDQMIALWVYDLIWSDGADNERKSMDSNVSHLKCHLAEIYYDDGRACNMTPSCTVRKKPFVEIWTPGDGDALIRGMCLVNGDFRVSGV